MRIVFMGTPDFAIPCLESLLGAGHEVVGVYCGPDREAGRGRRIMPPPMKRFAIECGLPVFQPASLRRAETQAELAALSPVVVVVAAYGALLPRGILETTPLGCLNVHPSLLPRCRGPSPVASAILEGDDVTGVTLMLLDEGMDTGPILAQRRVEVSDDDTASILTRRLFALGAQLLVETLPLWESGKAPATRQDDALATTTRKATKEDGILDWSAAATRLWRMVRAYEPWPGAYTTWRGKQLKVLAARPVETRSEAPSGAVVEYGGGEVAVATGDGLLVLDEVQLEGRRPTALREFLQGHPDLAGCRLPS